jgi:hypothetical protein
MIVEETKTEESKGEESIEEGGEADTVEDTQEVEAENAPDKQAGEAEVTLVPVAGES